MDLLQGFRQQLRNNPHAPCLIEDDHCLTYGQVARRAGGLAQALRGLALAPGRPVALALPRRSDGVCAVLGILAAGHCYLPLDLKGPAARRRRILASASAAIMIQRAADEAETDDLPRLTFDRLPPAPFPEQELPPESLAAILYTSGSTGIPKGVALSHRAILAFSEWARQMLGLTPADRIAAIAPLHFDLSTFDLFSVLSAGGTVDFVPEPLTMAPSRLTRWLSQRRISGFYTVPSLLAFWAWKGNLEQANLERLRFILFAGEPFPRERLKMLTARLPRVALHNFYGPTETNVCCHWPVNRQWLAQDRPIPIGRAACGDRLRIDQDSGELQVQGPTLFSGYWQNGRVKPALTADGWYATGDRVSRDPTGELIWQGRLDRMVKIAGHRVEPAEIEAVLQTLEDVGECAVIPIATPDGPQIGAAVVLAKARPLNQLRQALRAYLPAYMIPSRWLAMTALPRLSNGKPDLEALRHSLLENP